MFYRGIYQCQGPYEVVKLPTIGGISDTDDWLNWNGDMDNPNDSEEDCAADDDCDIEYNNCIEEPECPEQQDVCASPTAPGLVRPTRKSKRQAEKVLLTVNAVETRRNKGGKKK
jgi:hypothetical protein